MPTYVIYNVSRRQYRSDKARNHIVETWHEQTEFWAIHPADATPYGTFQEAKDACLEGDHVERLPG